MPLDFTARELTNQITQTHVPQCLITALFFADSKPSKNKFIEIRVNKRGKKIAPYVSPRVGGKVIRREGKALSIFEPPLMKPKYVTESDAILDEQSTFFADGLEPEDRALIQLDEDEKELKLMVERQKEMQVASLVTTGKFIAKGEGIEAEYDYSMSSDNIEIFVGSKQWSDDTSKPLDDLENWKDEIYKKTGQVADTVVMGTTAFSAFKNNPSVEKLFDKNHVFAVQNKPVELVDAEGNKIEGAGYGIYIEYLDLHVYRYNATFTDEDENSVDVYPTNKITMGVSNAGGHFAYGAIADRKELGTELFVGEIFVKSYWTDDPADEFLLAQSKGLGVPSDIDSFKTVEVVA